MERKKWNNPKIIRLFAKGVHGKPGATATGEYVKAVTDGGNSVYGNCTNINKLYSLTNPALGSQCITSDIGMDLATGSVHVSSVTGIS